MLTPAICYRLVAAFLFWAVFSASAQSLPAWRMVWSDEFSGVDGSAPSSSNWQYDIGGGGWGNSELETYTSRRQNSRIEGGMLAIEARRETLTGPDGIRRDYTSARLRTPAASGWTYGRFEARIKIPFGQGIWPAFWMLGSDFSQVSWPACGEVDIMENVGREPANNYGVAHGPGYSGGNGIKRIYTLPGGAKLSDDFHLFALEWETNRLRWSVDNNTYFTLTPSGLPAGSTWVFNKPFFIIMNVAVGGNFPGNPDGTTVFPQKMLVDYVRVYARTSAPQPSLQITPGAAAASVLWSGFFPHARLEKANSVLGPWATTPFSGLRESGNFSTSVPPGFYRLRIP